MEPSAASVVLALLALALRGEARVREPRREVPKPTNVTIESYNFNTSVHWDYKSIILEPFFIVEIRCYGSTGGAYVEVSSCVNISQHYCDLTYKVEECDFFWARVKAVDGPLESEYTESQQFSITRNGRIGPPKLNLSIVDHEIKVDIEHPVTPSHKKGLHIIEEILTDFTYTVFFWKKGNQEERQKFNAEDCTLEKCTIYLQIPSWSTSYCVSAHGTSEGYSMKAEESKESCINIPSKHQSDLAVPITVGVLVGLVVFVVIPVIVFICKQKENIKLPKSLVAVVRTQVNSFDTNTEPRNFSFITSSSYKPVSPEDAKCLNQGDFIEEVKTSDLSNCGKEVDPYDSQGLNKAGEMSSQEGMIVEISEGEQNSEENNYFKSISGQEEMDNNLPNVDFPKADVQQPTCCRNTSGYDKPHWKDSVFEVDSLVT